MPETFFLETFDVDAFDNELAFKCLNLGPVAATDHDDDGNDGVDMDMDIDMAMNMSMDVLAVVGEIKCLGLGDVVVVDACADTAATHTEVPFGDITELYDGLHSQAQRRSKSVEEKKRRRNERRRSPTARAKESVGRANRQMGKELLRSRWYDSERMLRRRARLGLAHAQSEAERQLCIALLQKSDRAVERSRTLCPKTMREQLNAIPRWDHEILLTLPSRL